MRNIHNLIKDPDTRNAIETLVTEFENKEEQVTAFEEEVSDLEDRLAKKENELEEQEQKIEELEEKIEKLEEALAEAYLTDISEKDDEV